MKALLGLLLLAAALTAHAQPRVYAQAELDALLAPVALYPDPLLSQVLVAATYPEDVREAAAWSRANAHLKSEDAVRAAEPIPWDPSVKALLAYPDLLARMDESPQWVSDLGAAFLVQEPQVMATVQALRHRAQASGFLNSDGYQTVEQHGGYIAVQPVYSHIVYVPWYNPVVVYGPWWHAHRPIAWRPWHPRPATFVSFSFHRPVIDWHRHRIQRPVHAHRSAPAHRPPVVVHRPPVVVHRPPVVVHRPPAAQHPPVIHRPVTVHDHVHQAQRAQPIIQGARIEAPFRAQPRREHRGESRWNQGSSRGNGHGRGHDRGRN